MKSILYLVLGLAAAAAVHGQGLPRPDSTLLQWKLQIPQTSPLAINGFLPSPEKTPELLSTPGGPLRMLKPDHMPCLVPDPGRLEGMPVRRSANGDPMPNGFRMGRAWSMEVRPAGKFGLRLLP